MYRDVLLVDLGQNRRHPRASAHDIKDLLMPKKGSSGPDRDQVAHWYEAQLVHYGLTRSRDKNTAKVRLMQAITAQPGGLTVPKGMVQLEKDLKKEYSAAVKKAVVANPPRPRPGSAEETGNKKKRKAVADGDGIETKTTTISVKVGDAVVQINQHTQASKRTKVVAAGAGTGKPTTSRTTNKDTTPKAKPNTKSNPKGTTVAPSPKPKNKTKKTTTSAARAAESNGKATTRNHVRNTVNSPTSIHPKQRTMTQKPTQSPRQQLGQKSYMHHHSDDNNDDNYYSDNLSDEPPPYDSIDFTNHRSSRASSEVSGRYSDGGGGGGGDRDPVQISGSYEISVPGIRTLCDLSLRIDHDSGKLWGRFGIGSKDGILRIDDISGAVDGETVSFGWRAEDDHTRDLRFGRGCFGEVSFDGRGHVQGRFVALLDGDDVFFDGSLVDDRGPDAAELSWQWDQFPERAYGRA